MDLILSKMRLCAVLAISGLILFIPSLAFGFVLVSGPEEARLEVSEEEPEVTFLLTLETPQIKNKQYFLNGRYVHYDDLDFWQALVQEAMDVWNRVPGSFIRLQLELSSQANLNSDDELHSIAISETNFTSAAFARPRFANGIIYDCDIAISSRSVDASSLAYTVLHELGHCLGLGHNHNDYSSVMGYARMDRNLSLGLDDMAGVVYLYPSQAIGDAKEWVSCGRIGQYSQGQKAPWQVILILLMPCSLPLLTYFADFFLNSKEKH